jgi:integrase
VNYLDIPKMPKLIKPLSDTKIEKTKAPTEGVIRLYDGGGLYLEITAHGSKLWRLKYSYGGRELRMALGAYPDVSLDDARAERTKAKALLAKGINPMHAKRAAKAAKIAETGNTFEIVAREWHEKMTGTPEQPGEWKPSHAKTIMSRMVNDVFPQIGKMPVADITAHDVLATVKRVAERKVDGRYVAESAHRILTNICQVMRYAVHTLRIKSVPFTAADIRGALPKVKASNRAAITDPAKVGGLLRSIYDYEGKLVTRSALKLAFLTVVRPGELRHAEWSEIDMEAAQWMIPGHKMKGGNDHIVPLSEQAMTILRELHAQTGTGRYVFPARPDKRAGQERYSRPMSNNAVLAALRRMDYDKDEMSGHGVRAIFRTLGAEKLHQSERFLELQLAHAVPDTHGNAYNRAAFLPERTVLMQLWANYLDSLRTGQPMPTANNVVMLRAG